MFQFCKKNKKNFSNGFTLVETLVAIGIFSTSILVMMIVLGGGIADTNYAKRKIIATYLAQEGIEYIRNIRDTYELFPISSDGWVDFEVTVANCIGDHSCYFYDGNLNPGATNPMDFIKILPCEDSICSNGLLYYNSATGRYNPGYSPLTLDSGFTRFINIELLSNSDEVKVSSTVHWEQGSGGRNITFSGNLFNWIE